jgi:hypothetical protein
MMNEPMLPPGRKAARRRSQFDALSTLWDRLSNELMKLPDPTAVSIAQGWTTAKVQYAAWLADPQSKITRSALVGGMKQGLRDMQLVLQGLPTRIREPAISVFRCIVEEEVPGFFAYERAKLARVVERGRVRNEDEWYLIRHRVEEIEGNDAHWKELSTLWELLDRYEGLR